MEDNYWLRDQENRNPLSSFQFTGRGAPVFETTAVPTRKEPSAWVTNQKGELASFSDAVNHCSRVKNSKEDVELEDDKCREITSTLKDINLNHFRKDEEVHVEIANIAVVGDKNCGKSTFVQAIAGCYENDIFNTYEKRMDLDNGVRVSLQISDTAGNSDFDRLRRLPYSSANGILCCFSIDSFMSLVNIEERWLPELRRYCKECPLILVGLKADLRGQRHMPTLSCRECNLVADRLGLKYYECCAVTDDVEFIFRELAYMIAEKRSRSKFASPWHPLSKSRDKDRSLTISAPFSSRSDEMTVGTARTEFWYSPSPSVPKSAGFYRPTSSQQFQTDSMSIAAAQTAVLRSSPATARSSRNASFVTKPKSKSRKVTKSRKEAVSKTIQNEHPKLTRMSSSLSLRGESQKAPSCAIV